MRSRWCRSPRWCRRTARAGSRSAAWRPGRGATSRPKARCRAVRSPSWTSCWPARVRPTRTRSSGPRSHQPKIGGKPTQRIDGGLKTTGTAAYAYERHDAVKNAAYGVIVGSAIAKGRIVGMDQRAAKAAPGVLAIVTSRNAGKLGKGDKNTALLLGGPEIEHYHQAVAIVVA